MNRYPVRLTLEAAEDRKRWLAFLGLVLLRLVVGVPQLLVIVLLTLPAILLSYLGQLWILFARKIPTRSANLIADQLIRLGRWFTWTTGATDAYPGWRIINDAHPVQLEIKERYRGRSRGWAAAGLLLVKLLVALPFMVAAVILGILALVVGWIGFLVVIVSGRLPGWIGRFLMGTINLAIRPLAWLAAVTDKLPRFGMDPGKPSPPGINQQS